MAVTPTTPHAGQKLLTGGVPLTQARAVMILVHGRGAGAQDILALADSFERTDVAYLAPQAAGGEWYPYGFMSPMANNEPGLSSGLSVLAALVADAEEKGIPTSKIMVLGFSQGACLTLEFTACNARRYGAIFGLSGGLIGPEGRVWDYSGSLDGTPVFLGCSDNDPHIPRTRVEESAEVFSRLGANVNLQIYPNMGHTVTPEEIAVINQVMANV